MTGENLSFAQYDTFKSADLMNLELHRALLEGLDVSFANFSNSNLRGAFLNNAILLNSCFHNSNLITAYICNTKADKAVFEEATLYHTKFDGSTLVGANFKDAKADGASFLNCDLSGANLMFKSQEDIILNNAFFDKSTLFNKGFDPIKAGMKLMPIYVPLAEQQAAIAQRLQSRISRFAELSRPLLLRERYERDTLGQILAANTARDLYAIREQIDAQPTDADLKKQLLSILDEKQEFYKG